MNMANEIIGREEEIKLLEECYQSGKAELVAVYGRRRVGKTYLVKNLFQDRFDFFVTGQYEGKLRDELYLWNRKLVECSGNFYPMPRDWNEAFEQLKHYLGTIAKKRVVIFIDEMPWLDTPKSKFVSAFEYFWNDWASSRSELMVIICGSATSGVWNFSQIRHCNYFLEQVLPKHEAGEIQGSAANIRHYIGEIYLIRAYAYFNMLQNIGDCPIVETALPDQEEVLVEASKRQPRHKVARFILSDLDKAAQMLLETSPAGKTRVGKSVAHLLRSRVALYEGTWLKHHKGTAFVPGGQGWPGKTEDASGLNIDSEISYFLTEAMASAKAVGEEIVGKLTENTDTEEGMDVSFKTLNPYYVMFCDYSLENYPEVLMWREYNEAQGVTHNIQMQLMRNGGGTGWTRGLVNSFLMENGLPVYASGSGYNPDWEKESVKATLTGRDSRIRIFTKKDGDADVYNADGSANRFDPTWIVKGNNETRNVTGFALKKGKHYNSYMENQHQKGTTASVVFRGAEALLNYIEACYEKNGNIDATADRYWRALRTRAKVNPDYNVTIAATDVAKEAMGDFGAYSQGRMVDATLYNIRRERRNELIGEGMRMADLKRWRALDQVKDYQIEGMLYWGSSYEGKLLSQSGEDLVIVDVDGGTGNMSDKVVSGPYIRPYQISKVNNSVFGGYNFTPAHYLNPLPQSVFR